MKQLNTNDYQDFTDESEINIPVDLESIVLSRIRSDLNPSHVSVFLKLLSVQSLMGLISLSFCTQFGLSLTGHYGIRHFLHQTFGNVICLAICATIFIGFGAFISSIILKSTEIAKIKNNKFLYYSIIGFFACLLFLMFGTDVYFSSLFVWFVSSIGSGVGFFELGQTIKCQLNSDIMN